jgi:hypothetical protein
LVSLKTLRTNLISMPQITSTISSLQHFAIQFSLVSITPKHSKSPFPTMSLLPLTT